MVAFLDNLPVLDYADLVGVHYRGQAVCNEHNCGTVGLGHESVQCTLHVSLTFGVKRTCGFVQQEHAGAPQQGSRNGNTLPLSS